MLVFKMITSITADKIYGHLDQPYLLEQEHKGCKKGQEVPLTFLY